MSQLSVVIVNYNGRHLLEGCLDGLEAQTRAADEVIVVDNGSTDGSAGFIRNRYPWVHVLDAGENLGFAGGNNLGIRESTGDIVILLNNDTLPGPGFVEEIVRPLETSDDLSAVAGVLLFSSEPEIVASAGIDVFENGLALDSATGQRWSELPREAEVFGPSAGAAAYRRSAIDDVDLFPEPYFLYLEDADLSWRLRLRGHNTAARRAAWTLHVYSASSSEGSALKDFHLARNRAWTLMRCWPGYLWRSYWSVVLWYEIGALFYALARFRWASIHGRIRGWTALGRLRKSRRRIQSRMTCTPDELLYWLRPAPSIRVLLELQRLVGNFADSVRMKHGA